MSAEYHRPFTVQAAQLAIALHKSVICPFAHSPKSKKYIHPDQCPRLEDLRLRAYRLLVESSDIPSQPHAVRVGGLEYVTDPLGL